MKIREEKQMSVCLEATVEREPESTGGEGRGGEGEKTRLSFGKLT